MTEKEKNEEIFKLTQLQEEGILSEEEFNVEKSKLLDGKVESKSTNTSIVTLIVLWIFSIIGLIIFFIELSVNKGFASSFLILASALIIFPPIWKRYVKKIVNKVWIILLISFLLLISGAIASPTKDLPQDNANLSNEESIKKKEGESAIENSEDTTAKEESVVQKNIQDTKDEVRIVFNAHDFNKKTKDFLVQKYGEPEFYIQEKPPVYSLIDFKRGSFIAESTFLENTSLIYFVAFWDSNRPCTEGQEIPKDNIPQILTELGVIYSDSGWYKNETRLVNQWVVEDYEGWEIVRVSCSDDKTEVSFTAYGWDEQ